MKAKIKGTNEWKEYKEVFGQYGEFLGLETAGYTQTEEEWCKEHGVYYDPTSPFNHTEGYYVSKILPLEAFDLCNEPNWELFRIETAKNIVSGLVSIKDYFYDASYENIAKTAIDLTNELIKQLKEGNNYEI